ncbi:MAG: hypothetical protein LUC92_10175 [Clostridiales bacterium]|nr:hypothetical protein [Clostridiales bacterium]
MATISFMENVEINGSEAVEKFVSALENTYEKAASDKSREKAQSKKLNDEEIYDFLAALK